MNKKEILAKVKRDEGMTVSEIKKYQKIMKPQQHVYGKYGTLAKIFLEEHNVAKLWALGGDLPKYLHGIDKQADELYEILYSKLCKDKRFVKTGDYLKDVQCESEMQQLIEEEILNELVYIK